MHWRSRVIMNRTSLLKRFLMKAVILVVEERLVKARKAQVGARVVQRLITLIW
jgi:hypothetical protein